MRHKSYSLQERQSVHQYGYNNADPDRRDGRDPISVFFLYLKPELVSHIAALIP